MAKQRPRPRRREYVRRYKKKVSILTTERLAYVDYKDVNLLRRFISDRAKVRARKVTGNNAQQQRTVAKAIKIAREMALLPYASRVTSQRGAGRSPRSPFEDEENPRPPADSRGIEALASPSASTEEVREARRGTGRDDATTPRRRPEDRTSRDDATTPRRRPEDRTSRDDATTPRRRPEDRTSRDDATTPRRRPEDRTSRDDATTPRRRPESRKQGS